MVRILTFLDWVAWFSMFVGLGSLAYAWGAGLLRGFKSGKPTCKQTEYEVKPLIVGREYMVRDANKSWRQLVYLGMDQNQMHTFLNIETGGGVEIHPHDGKAENLFKRGTVKWLEHQSEISRASRKEET